MLTYGDGVSDVNIKKLIDFHESHRKLMTMTAIQPEGRFGSIDAGADGKITSFVEKPPGDGAWINGGYFVCEPEVFDYIREGDNTIFERDPLESLAADGQIYSFQHKGFWKCMDTLRDKTLLEKLWESGERPWALWE
jgi:glucose-1-phosphate cytidylyltransferase